MSNKRQNDWTDRTQMTQGKGKDSQIRQILSGKTYRHLLFFKMDKYKNTISFLENGEKMEN